MELLFGGRVFDLTHRAIVLGQAAPTGGSTDRPDDGPDGLLEDAVDLAAEDRPAGSAIASSPTMPASPPLVVRVRDESGLYLAGQQMVAGLDLTCWSGPLPVGRIGPGDRALIVTPQQRAALVEDGSPAAANLIIDEGLLGPAPPSIDRTGGEGEGDTSCGTVHCVRLPGVGGTLTGDDVARLSVALVLGVRVIITPAVGSARRVAHVLARLGQTRSDIETPATRGDP